MSSASSVKTTIDGREVTLSNLEKVFYPNSGFTKGQMLDYYARIAPVMLGHLCDRPLTMKRYPDGVDGSSFFGKHPPSYAPSWLPQVSVPTGAAGEGSDYAVVCDLPSLIWVANLGTIEFHVPLWHAGRRRSLPGPPDHMVFDLDPGEGASVVECCTVALLIAEILEDRGSEVFPKTSGSKGLQLYAPLGGRPTWDKVREDAQGLAVRLERERPELVVSNMRKQLRGGKVLVDWSQNHPAKTTVAAYSLRARPEPTVSTPVTLAEVRACAEERSAALLTFTAPDVLERVDALGDLFGSV